jgi:hypothetical protein
VFGEAFGAELLAIVGVMWVLFGFLYILAGLFAHSGTHLVALAIFSALAIFCFLAFHTISIVFGLLTVMAIFCTVMAIVEEGTTHKRPLLSESARSLVKLPSKGALPSSEGAYGAEEILAARRYSPLPGSEDLYALERERYRPLGFEVEAYYTAPPPTGRGTYGSRYSPISIAEDEFPLERGYGPARAPAPAPPKATPSLQCLRCGYPTDVGDRECPLCGVPLDVVESMHKCEKCGNTFGKDLGRCPHCGTLVARLRIG